MINRFDVFVTSIATQCCEDKAAISCTIAELTGRGLITCEQEKISCTSPTDRQRKSGSIFERIGT